MMKVLELWRFDNHFRKLIFNCMSTVEFSLLINMNIYGSFNLGRGLRHGDPLSPFLFILCSEILTRMLANEEMNGSLHDIKINRNAPAVSHLMYAYGILIMCRANRNDVVVVKRCFDKYGSWSRQEANLLKSNILFSKNCNRKDRKEILEVTGLRSHLLYNHG